MGRQPIFGRYGRAGGWAGGQVVGGGEEDYDHGDDYDYTLDMEKLEPRMVIAKKRMKNRVGLCQSRPRYGITCLLISDEVA